MSEKGWVKDKFSSAIDVARDTVKGKVSRFINVTKDTAKDAIENLSDNLSDVFQISITPTADTFNESEDKNQTDSYVLKEWKHMYNVMLIAEKLVSGSGTINAKRYQSVAAMEYRETVLEPMLAALVETAESAAEKEWQYQRSTAILQSYYPNDKIYDFACDLVDIWSQDLTNLEPREYAVELYQNSLNNIRRLFQRMQERLCETELQPPKKESMLQRRLLTLQHSESGLRDLGDAIQQTRRIYKQVTADLCDDEIPTKVKHPEEFIKAARHLSSLLLNENRKITIEKLEFLCKLVTETLQAEELRICQMQPDIDRAKKLYAMLCDVLVGEKNTQLLDSLNPNAGALEELTAEQIKERYRPLIEQFIKITAMFKR